MLRTAADVLRKAPAGLLLAMALALSAPASAQAPREITLNSFKSSTLWPVWVAQKQGFLAKQSITVKNVYTQNSVAQMVGLIKGEFDMVTTALDNVIAYDEGEGSPQAPKTADLIAYMGGTNGALSLIARPEIKSAKELKGRDLAVDAIATGYTFVLREILAKEGLAPNDYKLVEFGNTGARWQALQKGQAAAGLLSPPVSQSAVAQGFINLADAAEVLHGYQGTVGATRRDWAKNNADVLVGFIRAYRQGLDWLKNPANKPQAIEILRGEIAGTSEAAGAEAYASLVLNPRGFDAGGKLDLAGANRVLELRRRYGPQGKGVADISRFIDESYFARAANPTPPAGSR
jgi:ABC-type nitrate/sulfonate/bicarbonate transport system substrate-binding protein